VFVAFGLISVVAEGLQANVQPNAAANQDLSRFPGPASVNRKLERAAKCALGGDYASTVRLASEVIDQHPSHAMAYVLRGTAHRRNGEYSQAIADLDRAIELDPRISAAYAQRADAYQQGHIRDSSKQIFADLNRAIELDKTNALAYILRGIEFATLNDHEAALADFDQALRLNPRSYTALANRASSKWSLGRLDEARRDLQKALELNPPAEDRKQIEESYQSLQSRGE
jgi:tetratricopeptide (TPR) repeat protein